MSVSIAIVMLCCLAISSGNQINIADNIPTPTQQYTHSVLLNEDRFNLYWNFNNTHVTFEVHAQTAGWVGIGISPSGSMVDADIHVGWVKNGNAKMTDRYGVSGRNTFPPLDPEQNIEVLGGRECDGWTVIKFRRQLAACEMNHDREITVENIFLQPWTNTLRFLWIIFQLNQCFWGQSDTIRLIYAHGSSDPVDDDLTSLNYHGSTNRGSRSMILLDYSGPATRVPANETHYSFDLLNSNVSVPAADTYYNCKLFKLPEFQSKQHIVKVEPVVQRGNELIVHHILLYQCIYNVTEAESIGKNVKCYLPNMPMDFRDCHLVIHAWAIGGGAFHYPPHAGYPLGTTEDPKYVVMETHYDNPDMKPNIVDSSGLRITYTPNLRQHDAGTIETGHIVSPFDLIIPPNMESFLTYGECTDQCLSSAMRLAKRQEINVFAVVLHSHLLGKGLTVRHLRNGTELPHIARDRFYDFNFQETRYLHKERVVREGDAVQVVCHYNSKGRSNITLGGLSTNHEMCLAYLMYYPKIPVQICETSPSLYRLLNHFGIYHAKFPPNVSVYSSINDILVIYPTDLGGKTYFDVVNNRVWNESTGDNFSQVLAKMPAFQKCEGTSSKLPNLRTHPALKVGQTYMETSRTCFKSTVELSLETNAESCSQSTSTPSTKGTTSGSIRFLPCSLCISFLFMFIESVATQNI